MAEGAQAAAGLAVGEIVAGKYRIEGILGTGGMATVFAAWHEELEQRVALKMLHAGLRTDATAVKRFMREAKNAARIQSEHVARIIDVGRMDAERVYIVMEYLEGNDLSRVLKARGALPVAEVVEHLVQACDALAVAHSIGVIHRDLKPANLFLTRRFDGSTSVKVLDFGIAKAFDAPEANELTSATTMIGSPLYMSPEQMANASNVDARADIWSLGVIAYRLLTTKLPFHGENVVELAMNIASRNPKSLRELRPDLPPVVEAAVMKCLERAPDARFADVGAFVQAIAPYGPPNLQNTVQRILRVARPNSELPPPFSPASGEHELLTRSATSPTLSAPSATSLPPPVAEPPPRRRGVLVFLLLLAVAGGGVAVVVARDRLAPTSAAPAREPEAKPQPTVSKPAESPVAALSAPSPAPSPAPSASAWASASASAPPKASSTAKAPVGIKPAPQKPIAKPTPSSKDVWGWE